MLLNQKLAIDCLLIVEQCNKFPTVKNNFVLGLMRSLIGRKFLVEFIKSKCYSFLVKRDRKHVMQELQPFFFRYQELFDTPSSYYSIHISTRVMTGILCAYIRVRLSSSNTQAREKGINLQSLLEQELYQAQRVKVRNAHSHMIRNILKLSESSFFFFF